MDTPDQAIHTDCWSQLQEAELQLLTLQWFHFSTITTFASISERNVFCCIPFIWNLCSLFTYKQKNLHRLRQKHTRTSISALNFLQTPLCCYISDMCPKIQNCSCKANLAKSTNWKWAGYENNRVPLYKTRRLFSCDIMLHSANTTLDGVCLRLTSVSQTQTNMDFISLLYKRLQLLLRYLDFASKETEL